MEFPEGGRISAQKFLEYFLSKQSYPPSATDGKDEQQPLPVTPSLAVVRREEVEGECMDMCRTFLANCSCPGLLNYNITAAAIGELMKGPLDDYLIKEEDDSPNKKYSGDLLALATVQNVHKICQKWSENLGVLVCPRERPEFSLHSVKNTRRKMEDRHSVCVDINTLYGLKDFPEDQSFFGVYDGHVGVEAAQYASRHLHHIIARHPSFISDPVTAIKEGIRITDERFCSLETSKAGTTAVIALLRGKRLYIGWIGDSQAVLVRNGAAVEVMNPHKPDREDEQQRIEAAGGLVINIGVWRVNGNLSVSRAIGDPKDKKYVIGEGEVNEIQLDGSEDYLVVACDGIWDVVDNIELTTCINDHFTKGGTKMDTAKSLVNFAKSEGSGDNLTAIVVFFNTFKPPTKPQIPPPQAKEESSTNELKDTPTQSVDGGEKSENEQQT